MNRRDRETLAVQAELYRDQVRGPVFTEEDRHTPAEIHETLERFMGVQLEPWQRAVADAVMTGRATAIVQPRALGRGVTMEWVAAGMDETVRAHAAAIGAVRAWRDETQRMPVPVTSPRAPQTWTDDVAALTSGVR